MSGWLEVILGGWLGGTFVFAWASVSILREICAELRAIAHELRKSNRES